MSTYRDNIKDVGTYTATEAAHYLRVPISTLRNWVIGQNSKNKAGHQGFRPVIQIADRKERLLSFNNLVEIHVLAGIRKVHEIPLPKIRVGLRYVERSLKTNRPLLTQKFLSDGLNLFIEHSGILLNVTQHGQIAIRETLEKFLQRVERDPSGLPIRLFPFSRHAGKEDTRSIVIDPRIAFGRPTLVGTGIATANIFARFVAGEPIDELAEDFNVDNSLIEEAIRCEQIRTPAA